MLTMGRRRFRSLQRMVAPVLQPPCPQEEGTGAAGEGPGARLLPTACGARHSSEVGPLRGRCPGASPGRGPVVVGGTAGVHFSPLASS